MNDEKGTPLTEAEINALRTIIGMYRRARIIVKFFRDSSAIALAAATFLVVMKSAGVEVMKSLSAIWEVHGGKD